CLEADVRAVALEVLRKGAPRLLHYDTGSDKETLWGLALAGEGAVDGFVHPAAGELFSGTARDAWAAGLPFAVCPAVEGDRAGRALVMASGKLSGGLGAPDVDRAAAASAAQLLETGESRLEEMGGQRVFIDVLLPPPALVIFGAGDD